MSFGPRNLVTLILVLLVPAVVFGEVPDINNCDISTRATEDVSVMICPACDGMAFSVAKTFGDVFVPMDATIEVYIRNNAGQALEGIAAENIWLEESGINFCPDGNIADSDTDATGYTEFAMPPCGGGCSDNLTLGGYLAPGTPFNENPLPHIMFNSPDTNGDLVVNLIDLSVFAEAYFLPATYCFDFYWDDVMDLRDLSIFAEHYTHACGN